MPEGSVRQQRYQSRRVLWNPQCRSYSAPRVFGTVVTHVRYCRSLSQIRHLVFTRLRPRPADPRAGSSSAAPSRPARVTAGADPRALELCGEFRPSCVRTRATKRGEPDERHSRHSTQPLGVRRATLSVLRGSHSAKNSYEGTRGGAMAAVERRQPDDRLHGRGGYLPWAHGEPVVSLRRTGL